MIRITSTTAALAAALASGCATLKTPPYVAPASGPVVHLKLRNAMDTPTTFVLYESAARCSRRRITPLIPPGQWIRLDIAADTELAMTANYVSSTRREACHVTISFPVDARRSYEIQMEPRLGGCAVAASLLDDDGHLAAPVVGRSRIPRTGWDEESDFCLP